MDVAVTDVEHQIAALFLENLHSADAVLLTDSRYIESAKAQAYPEFTVTTMQGGLVASAMPYLDKVNAKVRPPSQSV